MRVPVIDCNLSQHNAAQVASAMDRALREVGFMALTGLPVGDECVSGLFAASRRFFSAPVSQKMRCAYQSAAENFGYQRLGQERLDPAQPADLKETFTMRNLRQVDIASGRWPDAAFRRAAERFYGQAMDAALQVMALLAPGLSVPGDYFAARHSGENVTLRLLHYPAVDATSVQEQQMGAGAHTDYGMLTLLWQDAVGGLQVRDERGQWHDLPPRQGSVVLNAGDMLERWSNGRYRSTWHRVLPREPGQERFSIALFVDPDSATVIEALPGCTDSAHPPRYAPTTAGAHLQARIEATHRA